MFENINTLLCPQKKIVFGVVPSKNGNRCPRKSGLSSFVLQDTEVLKEVLKKAGMQSMHSKASTAKVDWPCYKNAR